MIITLTNNRIEIRAGSNHVKTHDADDEIDWNMQDIHKEIQACTMHVYRAYIIYMENGSGYLPSLLHKTIYCIANLSSSPNQTLKESKILI